MARENMRQMLSDVSYIGKPKLIENNTVQYQRANGDNVVRLHRTDVVTKRADGSQVLSSGGWRTKTTAERIRSNLHGASLISERGIWYLANADKRVPFCDGIVIGPNGELPNVSKKVATDQAKLGKRITEFVKLVGKNGAPIPLPSNGDCWLCMMRDQNGHTMGENDPSHLIDHINEGYLHGSLILAAMQWAKHTPKSIAHLMHGLGRPHHTSIRNALRRYLRHKLGLAV